MEPFPSHDAPGFDRPLDLLHACHIRIEQRCDWLERLVDYVAEHGSDPAARTSAGQILRYFDDAGPKHHQDEEADLFPLLLDGVAPAEREAAGHLIDRLRIQHRQMEVAWEALRAQLLQVEAGTLKRLDPQVAEHFSRLYQEHIQTEESELLPLARRVLAAGALRRLGAAMAARRNVPFPLPGN